jgi:putative aminopeptidase FrvX
MATPLPIDLDALKDFLIGLLNTPSPTGFTDQAKDYVDRALRGLPLEAHRTAKGSIGGRVGRAARRAPTRPER